MNKPNFYHASDYAGLGAKNAKFYYGYEKSICKDCGKMTKPGIESCDDNENHETEWCFVANFNDKEIIIPFSKLGVDEKFDMTGCLMIGIGWVLAKYKLVL